MTEEKSPIQSFVDEILRDKGADSIPDEVYEQLRQDLANRLEDQINREIINHLPADQLDEYNELLDIGTDEQIQEYIARNVPASPRLAAEVMQEFRESYLGS